jgi:GTPase
VLVSPVEIITTDSQIERAFLVGADVRGSRPLLPMEESLDELAELARTAGIDVVGRAIQHVKQIDPNTFIGSGKVEEIHMAVVGLNASVIIFDDELSPRHQREIENVMGEDIKVLDRSALILDIFAQHATTREGALQVELAQYEYRYPRLTRMWTHLARQAGGGGGRGGNGGVGLRGPGETQLEVDRRDIAKRISRLKADIEEVRAHRGRVRDQRTKFGTPIVALVGYTNAGKSTLLNKLTGANVLAENKLFATLDPTTRRLSLPGGKTVLMSDTVGFIQKLPTTLIAAFRATLEEVTQSDILIHVVDASHPNAFQQIETVEDTLAQIDTPPIPRILALNKIDRLEEGTLDPFYDLPDYDAIVPISAQNGDNIELLIAEIERVLLDQMIEVELQIPYKRGDLLSQVHELGIIDEERAGEQGTFVRAHVPPRFAPHLEPVIVR